MTKKLKFLMMMAHDSIRLPGLEAREFFRAEIEKVAMTLDEASGIITLERAHDGTSKRVGVHVSRARYWEYADDAPTKAETPKAKGATA